MLYEFIESTIAFLTDPKGLGFPILISTGLGIVLYMMNYSGKQWKKADRHIEDNKESIDRIKYPHEPF